MTDIVAASRAFMDTAETLPALYHLSADFTSLIDRLEDPEQDQDAIEAELHRIAGDIKRKAYGIAVVIQSLENLADLQKAEAKRQRARAERNEAHAARIREYVLRCMKDLGEERLETGTFTLAVRKNNPSVRVIDAAAVPGEFQRTTVTVDVDKVGILAHLRKTGEVVDGVEIVRNESLRIS